MRQQFSSVLLKLGGLPSLRYLGRTLVLTFTFPFLSSPLSLLFLPHFFSLAMHLVGFILVGKVFRKAFRILELDEREGMRVVEQDFHGHSLVNVTWFFWCP